MSRALLDLDLALALPLPLGLAGAFGATGFSALGFFTCLGNRNRTINDKGGILRFKSKLSLRLGAGDEIVEGHVQLCARSEQLLQLGFEVPPKNIAGMP